ncbi:hypothetical protein HaLaN_14831 [Haematococcus lacustris]|uniref:Uncharacterized protein n=1 Tax=Haematococcus lacustris TaxID=44745 RepID=A0A699ZGZ8_HAELA|nr:hypothetical protein HaLaN_14831 [Haematococcus lacustris]
MLVCCSDVDRQMPFDADADDMHGEAPTTVQAQLLSASRCLCAAVLSYRVSLAVNGQQPCERQLNKRRATRPADWKPPAGQVEPRLLRPAWSQQRDQPVRGLMWCPGKGKAQGKAAKAKPASQPGRSVDRNCNAALNMQRIGESRWRPLELCYWPDQGALPAKGKEYPGLGYKRLPDEPPKTQPAVAQ